MDNNEVLLREAERMANVRRLMLVVNAGTYTVWMIGLAINTGVTQASSVFWSQTQLWGMVGWILSLIGIAWTMLDARRRKKLTALVDDERTRHVTALAFMVGYLLLLFPLAGIYTASYFMPVNIRFVIPIMLAIGVIGPSITYATFFRP